MRKLLFTSLITLLLVSCSNDEQINNEPETNNPTENTPIDNTPVDEETPVEEEVQDELVKMIIKTYTEEVFTRVLEFNNGKISNINMYNSNNELTRYEIATYNANGYLHTVTGYNAQDAQIYQTIRTYDNLGRVIMVQDQGNGYNNYKQISYNTNNNTATVSSSQGGVKTCFINEDDLVFKEINENNSVYEVLYDGFNPISASGTSVTKTFEYLESPLPQESFYVSQWVNTMGPYKANTGIVDLEDYETIHATKFLKKEIKNGVITEYQYTFNTAGLPTKIEVYKNNVLQHEKEYIYQ